jgi:hypothetical protein
MERKESDYSEELETMYSIGRFTRRVIVASLAGAAGALALGYAISPQVRSHLNYVLELVSN